jgi:hypothetical protein
MRRLPPGHTSIGPAVLQINRENVNSVLILTSDALE